MKKTEYASLTEEYVYQAVYHIIIACFKTAFFLSIQGSFSPYKMKQCLFFLFLLFYVLFLIWVLFVFIDRVSA